MLTRFTTAVAAATLSVFALSALPAVSFAEETVEVGGAAMSPSKTIVENASASKDHTTLVAAVVAAGLAETLSSPGPFTVLAPVNAAFEALPAGTVDTLLKPENKAQLTKVLTYHVIAGTFLSTDLAKAVKDGGGSFTAPTVSGGSITLKDDGMGGLTITDESGGTAKVTIADAKQSNGVIHVIDKVLLPK
jgi:uncharacterized surface protein with fasciclin (FAS1) repeats